MNKNFIKALFNLNIFSTAESLTFDIDKTLLSITEYFSCSLIDLKAN